MNKLDCNFCDETITASSVAGVQSKGKTHIKNHHYSKFEESFIEKYGGKECYGECGYEYPVEAKNGLGFDCPQCGHDNFPEFAGRYIWWQIEVK